MEASTTIEPVFFRIIARAAAWTVCSVPATFVLSVVSTSSSRIIPRSASSMIPAFATTMSSLPCSFATPLTSEDTAFASVTSSASPAAAPAAAAASLARASSRPVTPTVAPASASARAVARPIPRVPPVTSAIRPLRSVILRLELGHHVHGDLEARHAEDLVGVELDVELVFDGRDQRHVADRVPRLDVAVLEVLDVHVAVEVQRLDEDLAQLGGNRHSHDS